MSAVLLVIVGAVLLVSFVAFSIVSAIASLVATVVGLLVRVGAVVVVLGFVGLLGSTLIMILGAASHPL